MNTSIIALCVFSAFCDLNAQSVVWQPSPGHTQMPIWPGAIPDAHPVAAQENAVTRLHDHLVAGHGLTYKTSRARR